MKKIIAVISIIAIICCLCSAVSAAEEGEDVDISTSADSIMTAAPETSAPTETAAPETSAPAETAAPETSAPAETAAPETSAPAETAGSETSAPAETAAPETSAPTETSAPETTGAGVLENETDGRNPPFGDWVLGMIKKYATEIFTAVLALIGSLAYISQKTNLIPALNLFTNSTNESVSSIKSAVGEFKDTIMKTVAEVKDDVHIISNNADNIRETVTDTVKMCKETIMRVDELQSEQRKAQGDREVLKKILTDQVEMLNTIIQASTLEQWRKKEIGEKFVDNKKMIAAMIEKQAVTEEGEECV